MGIHKLMDLIREYAPDAIRKRNLQYYSGMSFALDASMSMYQFLVSTQGISSDSNFLTQLTDNEGNKTGHLLGLFNRTILLCEYGIKPVWVFDGPPPKKKNGEILRRKKIKQEAIEKKDEAEDVGKLEQALKQQQRTTYISHQEKNDAMQMLRLMGVPVIQAPGQAEAQCSHLNKKGRVDAVCTEDTDSIVFGTQLLIRQMNNKKEPICEVDRQLVLKGLNVSEQQFIDMCILCGCDYAQKIEGIGPVKAYKFIHSFGTVESILQHCHQENEKKQKYKIPKDEDFAVEEVRQLFKHPNVIQDIELKWGDPNQESLKKFLVQGKGFSEQRVEAGLKKLVNSSKKGVQPRLQAFFGKPTIVKSTNARKEEKSAKKGKKGKKSLKKS